MNARPVRTAVRGLILHADKLLLVNAYAGGESDLWCAPGGGIEKHQSLPDNLVREVYEETGLTVAVEAPVLVNEFHDPDRAFHQIDVYFRCHIVAGALSDDWTDPEGVVDRRRFVSRDEIRALRFKPDSLPTVAWDRAAAISYDPLELIVR